VSPVTVAVHRVQASADLRPAVDASRRAHQNQFVPPKKNGSSLAPASTRRDQNPARGPARRLLRQTDEHHSGAVSVDAKLASVPVTNSLTPLDPHPLNDSAWSSRDTTGGPIACHFTRSSGVV
jgi:hypothetical protein